MSVISYIHCKEIDIQNLTFSPFHTAGLRVFARMARLASPSLYDTSVMCSADDIDPLCIDLIAEVEHNAE